MDWQDAFSERAIHDADWQGAFAERAVRGGLGEPALPNARPLHGALSGRAIHDADW